MKTTLFLISLLYTSVAFTQKVNFFIAGKILSEEGEIIKAVSIWDSVANRKLLTCDSSYFLLKKPKRTQSLSFKADGYQTKTIVLTKALLQTVQNDTLFLTVILASNAVELDEINISSSTQEQEWPQQPICVYGKIIDEDGEPILNVSVKENNTKKQARVIGPGTFCITVQGKKNVLVFKGFGYQTKKMLLSKSLLNLAHNDTLQLTVLLIPEIIELDEVEIMAKKVQLAYEKPQTLIFDYEVLEAGYILLIKEDKNYLLREVDFNSKTLAQKILGFKPKQLFKNCFGEIMLLTEDSAYQIYVHEDSVLFSSVTDIAEFYGYVKPCVAGFSDVIFFQDYAENNQKIIYSYTKPEQPQKLLRTIVDENQSKGIQEFKAKNEAELYGSNLAGELNAEELKALRQAMNDGFFLSKILHKPVYHPGFKVNQWFYVFDHYCDSVLVYTRNGKKINAQPIQHHKLKNWQEQIVFDKVTNMFYTFTRNDGVITVYELHNATFLPRKKYVIQDHAFVENIKIHGGYIYYIYKEKNDFALNNLYRQRLY